MMHKQKWRVSSAVVACAKRIPVQLVQRGRCEIALQLVPTFAKIDLQVLSARIVELLMVDAVCQEARRDDNLRIGAACCILACHAAPQW